MKTIAIFERTEYQKLMETLGLAKEEPLDTDKSIYFNAWNFGQTEQDFEFIISSLVSE